MLVDKVGVSVVVLFFRILLFFIMHIVLNVVSIKKGFNFRSIKFAIMAQAFVLRSMK